MAPACSHRDRGPGASPAAAAPAVAAGSPVAAGPWRNLTQPRIWKGTEEAALAEEGMPCRLAPPWRVMLLSDGSVTRHLELLGGLGVEVECLEMGPVAEHAGAPRLPSATALIRGPLVQRQVLLRQAAPGGQPGQALVYAASWWSGATVDRYLRDKSQPIWASLSRERTELYREILFLDFGNHPFLEERFGVPGPFWGREYIFWHGGRPLTVIYEAFSSALEGYLGPACCSTTPGAGCDRA